MRILVCGGRNYTNRDFLRATLNSYSSVTYIIHGAATGADSLAGEWARDFGIQEVKCPANWEYFRKYAGLNRNTMMLGLIDRKKDLVIAFPGGTGTAHMVQSAKDEGFIVDDYQEE